MNLSMWSDLLQRRIGVLACRWTGAFSLHSPDRSDVKQISPCAAPGTGPFIMRYSLLYLASSAFVKIRLVPQIQKTHRLPESEKKSAGFLNLREITNPEDGEYSPVIKLSPKKCHTPAGIGQNQAGDENRWVISKKPTIQNSPKHFH